jgi:orotidine-5'-phosphate decarboxylase
MGLFKGLRGIIPACDLKDGDKVLALVKATASLDFIHGYKLGTAPSLANGLPAMMSTIRKYTDLPVIYDHQKFGTDVPDVCSGELIEVFVEAKVNAVIIFPQAGPETLKAAVNALFQARIVPIVGGEMTHPRYLEGEGGYLSDKAPMRIYTDAAKLGVEYFVVPGTRPESIEKYKKELSKLSAQPKFLFPGIGKGQGGDIAEAFRRASPYPSWAIVGRGIYGEIDHRASAQRLWTAVEQL